MKIVDREQDLYDDSGNSLVFAKRHHLTNGERTCPIPVRSALEP
jgi:hypothetical protein